MNSYYADLLVDIAPGLTLVSVAAAAALPPYLIMYQSKRGRARSAIAYILGFFAGLATTILIAVTIGLRMPQATAIHSAGMIAAFFAPFGGMLRARLRRPPRRQPRGHAYARDFSR